MQNEPDSLTYQQKITLGWLRSCQNQSINQSGIPNVIFFKLRDIDSFQTTLKMRLLLFGLLDGWNISVDFLSNIPKF